MKKILMLSMMALSAVVTYAQQSFQLQLKNSEEKIPLAGATATISALNKIAVADSAGVATFTDLPAGNYEIVVSFAGMEERTVSVSLPLASPKPIEVLL